MPQPNLVHQSLKKLLADQTNRQERKSLTQSRRFPEMLRKTLLLCQNRTIKSAEVIPQMIGLARQMWEAHQRAEKLGPSEEVLAFNDPMEVNNSALYTLGDDSLRTIACELADTARRNTTIDCTPKESVWAKLRTMIKWVLREYGCPPDEQGTPP